MPRIFHVNGESLVLVRGRSDSTVIGGANGADLGLSVSSIEISLNFRHTDINVDAWGPEIPADVQVMLADAIIRMTLVHYDKLVLNECWRLSMGGTAALGRLTRAGTTLGGGVNLLAAGNNYIRLFMSSPIDLVPWRFFSAYLTGPATTYPIGSQRSLVGLTWRAIPYGGGDEGTNFDPYGGGFGAGNPNFLLFDHATAIDS